MPISCILNDSRWIRNGIALSPVVALLFSLYQLFKNVSFLFWVEYIKGRFRSPQISIFSHFLSLWKVYAMLEGIHFYGHTAIFNIFRQKMDMPAVFDWNYPWFGSPRKPSRCWHRQKTNINFMTLWSISKTNQHPIFDPFKAEEVSLWKNQE